MKAIDSFNGLNNVTDPMRLGASWLTLAENVDVTDSGGLVRRNGYELERSGSFASAAALKQFHTLSELLARELHTTPEAESRDLFRAIANARHTRGQERAGSEHASAPPRPRR